MSEVRSYEVETAHSTRRYHSALPLAADCIRRWVLFLPLIVLLAGCIMPDPAQLAGPSRTPGPASTVPATPTALAFTPAEATPTAALPPGIEDATALFDGVCFAYLVQQVNRIFVIQTAFEHIDFYNSVDGAAVCRFAVTRHPFDFTSGRILVGAVNVGTGCTAVTDLLDVIQDDAAQAVIVRARWGVQGDCAYRLARPFFLSIPHPPEGYRVAFEFVPLEAAPPTPTPPGVG